MKAYAKFVIDDGAGSLVGAESTVKDSLDIAHAVSDALSRLGFGEPLAILSGAIVNDVFHDHDLDLPQPQQKTMSIHVKKLYDAAIYFGAWEKKWRSIQLDPLLTQEQKDERCRQMETEFEPFDPRNGPDFPDPNLN